MEMMEIISDYPGLRNSFKARTARAPSARADALRNNLFSIKYFQNDRLTIISIIFSIIVYAPSSLIFFTIGENYLVEIPILVCIALCIYMKFPITYTFIRKMILYSIAYVLILAPFTFIGLFNTGDFGIVYRDFRATLILLVLVGFLFSLPDQIALRFIVITSFFCIIFCALTFPLKIQKVNFDSVVSGKLAYPLAGFSSITILLAMYRRLISIPLILAMGVIAFFSSLRQLYLIDAVIALLSFWGWVFPPSNKWGRIWFVTGVISSGIAAAIFLYEIGLYEILISLEKALRISGVDEGWIQQLVAKTMRTVAYGGGASEDQTYIYFRDNLLNAALFWYPHGLGHIASLGDPLMMGGNSIDNSIIYIDYHYSAWMTYVLLSLGIWQYFKRMHGVTVSGHLVVLMFILPVAIAFYTRGTAMTVVPVSVGFAFSLRCIDLVMKSVKR